MVIQLPGTKRQSPTEQGEQVSTLPPRILRKLEWLARVGPGMLRTIEMSVDQYMARAKADGR